jgi:hypothetical protein
MFIIATAVFTVITDLPYFPTIFLILQVCVFIYLAYALINFLITVLSGFKTKNV